MHYLLPLLTLLNLLKQRISTVRNVFPVELSLPQKGLLFPLHLR